MKKNVLLIILSMLSITFILAISADTYIDKGDKQASNGNFKKAIEFYSKAIEIDPSNYRTFDRRCFAKMRVGDNKGMIEDSLKAIKLNPNDPVAYYGKASAEFGIKKYDDAIKDCSKSLELDNSFCDVYILRAACYVIIDQIDNAKKDLNTANNIGCKKALNQIKKLK